MDSDFFESRAFHVAVCAGSERCDSGVILHGNQLHIANRNLRFFRPMERWRSIRFPFLVMRKAQLARERFRHTVLGSLQFAFDVGRLLHVARPGCFGVGREFRRPDAPKILRCQRGEDFTGNAGVFAALAIDGRCIGLLVIAARDVMAHHHLVHPFFGHVAHLAFAREERIGGFAALLLVLRPPVVPALFILCAVCPMREPRERAGNDHRIE